MKGTFFGAVTIGVLLASAPAFAAKTNYKADIEGSAVDSPGTGVGNFTFDDVTKKLCGKATYDGLTGGPVTVAALKEGDGFTIVKSLAVSGSPLVVDVTLGDDAAALLASGPVYIAIGNAAHGVAAGEALNGEVNGELVVDPEGTEQPCGETAVDGGVPSGSTPDAASPSDAGVSANGGDAAQPGAAPPSPDSAPPAKKQDDGGCSTSGSSTGSAAVFAIGSALVFAMRKRRRR